MFRVQLYLPTLHVYAMTEPIPFHLFLLSISSRAMLTPSPCRPDTSTCLLHPYFWDAGKRLTFLQDASDRFEVMCRDPKDPHLLALEAGFRAVLLCAAMLYAACFLADPTRAARSLSAAKPPLA